MTDLLGRILDAHGGLERWGRYRELQATIITGGEFWAMKGLTQDQCPRLMHIKLHEQWASVAPFVAPDMSTDYTPGRIAIVKTDGTVVAARADPRETFIDHVQTSPWDPLHRAYFNGYALWTYLTTPFLMAFDGVQVEEIDPWEENGESWRVLRASFPDAIATHSPIQDFFFGADLLLRRHDYNVDVAGGFAAAQLVSGYADFGGIKLPTRRRAYQRGPDRRPLLDPLMVSIDISSVQIT